MGNKLCMPRQDMNGTSTRFSPDKRDLKHSHSEKNIATNKIALAMERSKSRQNGEMSARRPRSQSDSFSIQKQEFALGNTETKKFVLVHGEGFGAWCWYKTIALLEKAGMDPVALDLNGAGVNNTDASSVRSLAHYAKPLIDYLQSLPVDEKVILVGHSCGGASISVAIECCPKKISKAVFISATMVVDGQRTFDMLVEEQTSAEISMQESQNLVYSDGEDKPPTAFMFSKQQMQDLYLNCSPHKDIVLATIAMRPMPLQPIMEKLSLTPKNYGTVRRFFIQTLDDRMLLPSIQEKLVKDNPPHGVFKIKGSDHCPFFSKPQSLNKLLLEIAQLP